MKNHIKSLCPHGAMEARVTSNHKVVGSNPTGDFFFYWYNLMIIYFNHPKQVCMTYLQHMLLSFRFSYLLCVGSIQAFIHGIHPDLFIDSTSTLTKILSNTLKNSGC